MTSGSELLEHMRQSKSDWPAFAHNSAPDPDEVIRPGLVAALLSGVEPADAPLVRALTREEIAAVREAEEGCGDTLLACCWLLFMLGNVEDAPLIWEAKHLNFDTGCTIESEFLIPRGREATAAYAQGLGLEDLASWVMDYTGDDSSDDEKSWRISSYFADIPPASDPIETLAASLRI